MKWDRLVSILVGFTAVLASGSRHGHSSCGDGLTVRTTSGELHGFINSTAPFTRQFLGVPFAEPPVGKLRFKPPVRKRSSTKVSARTYAPSCKQQISNSTTIYTDFMPQFLINGQDSENCLYLNVFAPLYPTEEQLPVFIYIPGGGFTGGGANSLYKIPDKWVNKTQSHIVITINYRLNIFGFPSARDSFLNLGLLDQRLVVEWAYDNIAGFGGDPERMVLWGQSAGGMSASYYAYGFHYDPIARGLISDSGAASDAAPASDYFGNFSHVAGQAGCEGLNARAELECMQRVDADTLQKIVSSSTTVRFGVHADGLTMFTNLTERASQGLVANLPMIQGNNDNEGAGFGPASGETQATWEVGLHAIVCPTSNQVALRDRFGLTTYRYYYSGNFSNISPQPWIGASHSAELPLLFDTHWEYRGDSTEFEYEVAALMQGLWLAFAFNSSADPTYGKLSWPRYRPGSKTMLHFATGKKAAKLVDGSTADSLCPNSTCPTCAFFPPQRGD